VRFLGQLQDEALDAMLAASWVHAIPSVWAEPFGITTTEAMMRGVAVVGSDTGGLTESIDQGITGYRVPPGDAPALADALVRVLGSPDVARNFGAQGRRRALEHFGLPASTDRFEAIHQRIVGGFVPRMRRT
jgi:glycosyltransferase involved in cell wall biosynthesis